MEFNLTPEEKRAIRTLKVLEKIWPKTLWLFSNGMSISIMRTNERGEHATLSERGGMDQEYIVDSVDINNDGGDWQPNNELTGLVRSNIRLCLLSDIQLLKAVMTGRLRLATILFLRKTDQYLVQKPKGGLRKRMFSLRLLGWSRSRIGNGYKDEKTDFELNCVYQRPNDKAQRRAERRTPFVDQLYSLPLE